MIFVTSWDDGFKLDARVADLLDKYNLKGTFYIPIRNQEGREVMSRSLITDLDKAFEVGSHTLDHVYLTAVNNRMAIEQIRQGKSELEDILSHEVGGFCYPGGRVNARIRAEVNEAGFRYARTTHNMWMSRGQDKFMLPTSIQFYPHSKMVYIRNYIRWGWFKERFEIGSMFMLLGWVDALKRVIESANASNNSDFVFHLWGHSWEIEANDMWRELEEFFIYISELEPSCLTVAELADGIR